MEQPMQCNAYHRTISTQTEEPRPNNAHSPRQSGETLCKDSRSSKRKRQRRRKKQIASGPESSRKKLDNDLNQFGCMFSSYLKQRFKQHNTSEMDAMVELDKFTNVLKSRQPGLTCIDAVWELMEFTEGPHHCSRLLTDKFEQRFAPFKTEHFNDDGREQTEGACFNAAAACNNSGTIRDLLRSTADPGNLSGENSRVPESSIDLDFEAANFENDWNGSEE